MATPHQSRSPTTSSHDDGFILLTALVMVFLVLLVLSLAAPRIAKSIQRDRELESEHRAQQYVDPLTGKDDWRLIHVGENQTKVKGFFGEDLPGLGAGLGSAAGMSSTTGGSAFGNGSSNTSAFGNNPAGGPAGATGTSAFGQNGTSSGTTSGTTSSSTSGTTTGTGGISSQSATSFTGSGGAPIMGVGSAKSGEAMLVVNEQTTYDTWEFLYDPRIEQLYAKSTLLGGISSGSGSSNGLGNGTSTGNGFGNPSSLGFGNSNTPGSGTTPPASGTPTPPTSTGTNPPGVP